MFIGRLGDGTIYGLWAVRQVEGQEELASDSAEIVAFLGRTLTQLELEVSAKARFDSDKMFKAKCISDLAFRLGKAPGALTALELQAERDRIAAIYKAL